ncbi:MAG TPA: flavin reductase family protein, partial [Candidatus Krumholzibacterium sp.]|nr:flavin reductase family protein [Candidatus Krumholzibacterium sp.]
AWFSQVNYKPRLIAVTHGKSKYTNGGIIANGAFSVNIPGVDLMEETDYAGIVSGRDVDKGGLFDLFYGEVENAPMIVRCPVCMECRLVETFDLPSTHIFVGEVVNQYADEEMMDGDLPDLEKFDAFTLAVPNKEYRRVGGFCGEAFKAGRELKK